MTPAVLIIFATLISLLLLHVFWIAYLWGRSRRQAKLNLTRSGFLVIYASQSGHVEAYAKQTALQLQQIDQLNALVNIQDLTSIQLQQAQQVLWMVSTYGDGDAPDSARLAVKRLFQQTLDLSQQSYAVLAFGDRRYSHFCQFGQTVASWVQQQGAQAYFDLLCVDHFAQADLDVWQKKLQQIIDREIDFSEDDVYASFVVKQRTCLNKGSSGAEIYQLQLQTAPNISWLSGDILEVQCENSAQNIQAFLQQHQQGITEKLSQQLRYKNLRDAPVRLSQETFNAWLKRFQHLPTRDYSIASIPEQGYVELVIRQQHTPEGLGLGSGWLTQRVQLGEMVQARIRSNPHFHLPSTSQALILIGNGTGIAGLISHLQQRVQQKQGQNWLIFGERQQQYDHLYREKIELWQQQGSLIHVDYAFSRDQAEKIYVQDRLYQQAQRLKDWVQAGAAIYVCGSLQGMGQAVEQALCEILGSDTVDELRQQQRYQRDVY